MVKLATEAKVPVTVFLDHAKDFTSCLRAIRLGFSAVMIDGSYLPFEGELGALAGIEDGEAASMKLTNPADVPGFAERTVSTRACQSSTSMYWTKARAPKTVDNDVGAGMLGAARWRPSRARRRRSRSSR